MKLKYNMLLKIVFLLKNRERNNVQYLWQRKLKKYYLPLERYYLQYKQNIKTDKLTDLRYFMELLVAEANKEIALIPRIAVIITTKCSFNVI